MVFHEMITIQAISGSSSRMTSNESRG